MKAFEVDVSTVAEGVKLLDVLADYDRFQFENNVKPDYCNVGGLRRWCADNGDGVPGWEDWYDEETGEDDPAAWLEAANTVLSRVAATDKQQDGTADSATSA